MAVLGAAAALGYVVWSRGAQAEIKSEQAFAKGVFEIPYASTRGDVEDGRLISGHPAYDYELHGAIPGLSTGTPTATDILIVVHGLNNTPAPVSFVSLAGDPAKPKGGVVKLKLFFGDDHSKPDYAELFLNIDMARQRLTLAEKASDYEAPIVRQLGHHRGVRQLRRVQSEGVTTGPARRPASRGRGSVGLCDTTRAKQ